MGRSGCVKYWQYVDNSKLCYASFISRNIPLRRNVYTRAEKRVKAIALKRKTPERKKIKAKTRRRWPSDFD